MDIQEQPSGQYFFNDDSSHAINLKAERHDGLYVSFETCVGYGVHILNDGAVVVNSARNGRSRYFSVEELIRTALAEGLDPEPGEKGGGA